MNRVRRVFTLRAQLPILVAVAAILLLGPLVVVVVASFSPQAFLSFPPSSLSLRWYQNFFDSVELTSSVGISLLLATLASFGAVALGGMAAVGLIRGTLPFRRAALNALMIPVAVPGVLLGLAFLQFIVGTPLQGTLLGLVLAHVTLTLPFTARTAAAALAKVKPDLEEAARSLGAGPRATFWRITLPQMRAGLLAGGVFAFIVSFNDYPISVFVAGDNVTLPIRIYTYVEYSNDPTIAAISTVLMVVLLLVILISERLFGISRFVTQLD